MPWTLTSQKIKWTDNRHIFKGNEALVGVTILHITSTIGKNNNNNFAKLIEFPILIRVWRQFVEI